MGEKINDMPPDMRKAVLRQMGKENVEFVRKRKGPAPQDIVAHKIRVAPESYNITLPWPPTVNHYYQRTKIGMIVGKRGIAYRIMVCLACRGAIALEGRLKVTVLAYPPDKRKRDVDNLFKALLDAVQHAGVYHDDNQIDILHIERKEVIRDGKVIVTVDKLKEVMG